MVSSWIKPPPVVVLSGSHDYYRKQELKKALAAAQFKKRSIEYYTGLEPKLVETALSGSIMFSADKLVVLSGLNMENLDSLIEYQKNPDSNVSFLVHLEKPFRANSKLAKHLKGLKNRLNFNAPKPWEEEPQAVSFCVSVCKKKGIELPTPLAQALVKACGTDLGVLYYEIDKLSMLLKAKGASKIEVSHLKATITPLVEVQVFPLLDGLALKSVKRVSRHLMQMQKTHKYDPTMLVCGVVGKTAIQWLHVLSLREKGFTVDQISKCVGISSSRIQKKVFPALKNWSTEQLLQLIQVIVDVERSVKKGYLSPWYKLEESLISLCIH